MSNEHLTTRFFFNTAYTRRQLLVTRINHVAWLLPEHLIAPFIHKPRLSSLPPRYQPSYYYNSPDELWIAGLKGGLSPVSQI